MWLGSIHFLAALEWMALANQLASLDALPQLTASALMNLSTMALDLDKVIPVHVYSEEICVGWVHCECWPNNAC